VRRRSAVLLLVSLTALPRLVALIYEGRSILVDNVDKGDVFARTFLETGTYGFIPGHPSAYTQPLYGWFLIPLYWIFGHHWLVVGLAQVAVACGTTLIVWQIGCRWLSPAAGVLAGAVVAVHPYLIWHDIHMNREILDHFLAAATVFLTLLALERLAPWRLAALGAVLGLAILGNVRLEALPFVLLAYLFVAKRRFHVVGAVALLAAAAVVVMPWVARTRADVGCWTVTTDARALWKANNANTLATLRSGQWIDHVPQPASFPPTPQDVYERWLAGGGVQPYDECAQMSSFQRKVLSFWANHPAEKAQLAPIDAQWLWQPSVVEVTDRRGEGTWLDTMRSAAEPAYMIILYVLGAVGLFVVPRRIAALALILLSYQTATAVLFVGETRYRVPWDFLIGLLASYAALRIRSMWSELVSANRLRTSERS
jgi:4-amino-4-deoxy-L-arabinose transferase-like glycosyltransferase